MLHRFSIWNLDWLEWLGAAWKATEHPVLRSRASSINQKHIEIHMDLPTLSLPKYGRSGQIEWHLSSWYNRFRRRCSREAQVPALWSRHTSSSRVQTSQLFSPRSLSHFQNGRDVEPDPWKMTLSPNVMRSTYCMRSGDSPPRLAWFDPYPEPYSGSAIPHALCCACGNACYIRFPRHGDGLLYQR